MGRILIVDTFPKRIYVYPLMKSTVFTSGGSQAVRIPKDYRFNTRHVEVRRSGASLILTPVSEESGWPEGYIEAILSHDIGEDFVRHPQGEHREINF